MLAPFIDDHDFKLYVGDVRDVLDQLPAQSVHMVVTSPPYWGLRDYGTGTWGGGDPDCDHEASERSYSERSAAVSSAEAWSAPGADNAARLKQARWRESGACVKCGAVKVDKQIGLEPTPDEYVDALVDVFRSIRRVLRDDGTAWLNLGDSYAVDHAQKRSNVDALGRSVNTGIHASIDGSKAGELRGTPQGLKPKDLVGIPWRTALALQGDGWWLRQDNVWSKTSCMPESVEGSIWERHRIHVTTGGVKEWVECPGCAKCAPDGWVQSWGSGRTTKSHEYLFQLAKSERYYYDIDAVREPYAPDNRLKTTVAAGPNSAQHRNGERWPNRPQTARAWELFDQTGLTNEHLAAIRAVGASDTGKAQVSQSGAGRNATDTQALADEAKAALGGYYREFLTNPHGRNKRSVWTIGPEPYSDAHFATYPTALVAPTIKAGTSEGGVCPACGAPYLRMVNRLNDTAGRHNQQAEVADERGVIGAGGTYITTGSKYADRETNGWRASCRCDAGKPVPAVVLDPFMGSGTTALIARRLGRHAVGVELNEKYATLCAERTKQLSLLAEGAY